MHRERPPFPYPDASNGFLASHIRLLRMSHRALTGRPIIGLADEQALSDAAAARILFEAPLALLSHDGAADPVLTYGNRTALELFELNWVGLITLPSRLTAEAPDRAERARLLAAVTTNGFIENYAGIRVSAGGRRFRIEQATVWNLIDESGRPQGQAAAFGRWSFL